MSCIDIDRVKPGMILDKPVHSPHGVLLLNEGTKITEKNIWVLKSWGVTEVSVEGKFKEEKNINDEPENRGENRVEKKLKEKFSQVLENKVMAEIMRVAGKQLERRIIKKAEKNETH